MSKRVKIIITILAVLLLASVTLNIVQAFKGNDGKAATEQIEDVDAKNLD